MTAEPVRAFAERDGNVGLIADCVSLGYLRPTDVVLDCTYGFGTWWQAWKPDALVASDLDPKLSPFGSGVDFTAMPWHDGTFDVVCFDPPYKLNGTPSDPDVRYGVGGEPVRWQERHALIKLGVNEVARVVRPDGVVLLKCQDQVCSGAIRWQTMEFAEHAAKRGLRLVDELHLIGEREQPERRRKDGSPVAQKHARRNASTLLVLRRRKVRAR